MKQASRAIRIFMYATLISANVWAGGGGDVINNGGGLSEQSVLYASVHFQSMSESCQKFTSCAAQGLLKDYLQSLNSCTKPDASQIKFSADLNNDVLFQSENQTFVINRKKLYSGTNEALRIPEAFGFLTRIYLDYCGQMPFSRSNDLVKPIEQYSNQQGEQITIGKENINLPKAQWIRVRSLYSDLLIETPKMLLRLSCFDDKLSNCSFQENSNSTSAKFRNLGLRSETLSDGVVQFQVEGYFVTSTAKKQFSLVVDSQNGIVKRVMLQDHEITLP